MKLTEEKLDKFVEFIKNHLRKALGREPTEKEVVNSLPVFMCHMDEAPYKGQ